MSDREQLTKAQDKAVKRVEEAMVDALIEKTEEFYKEHPELQLSWTFLLNPFIRDKHDTVPERIARHRQAEETPQTQ